MSGVNLSWRKLHYQLGSWQFVLLHCHLCLGMISMHACTECRGISTSCIVRIFLVPIGGVLDVFLKKKEKSCANTWKWEETVLEQN